MRIILEYHGSHFPNNWDARSDDLEDRFRYYWKVLDLIERDQKKPEDCGYILTCHFIQEMEL